jgi:hypothetical protein
MTQDTLREFRAAEEKLAPGSDDDVDDWTTQKRRRQKKSSKINSRDMKKTIEDGRLWTGDN